MERDFSSGLDVSREFLAPIVDEPLYSETGAYSAYDPTQNIGFWMHLGRFSYDPTVWHEALMIYLPDGTRLAFKNYGRSDATRGPAGSLMSFQCIEPFKRWQFKYDGPAQRVDNDILFAGGLRQGREERLIVDLTIDSVKPIWDMGGHGDDTPGGKSHDEQLSEAHGSIVSDDGTLEFHGAGWRDHGRGPRDIGSIKGHTILGGWFPDEDCGFVAIHVEDDRGTASNGQVFIGDEREPLSPVLPTWGDPRSMPMSFDAVLPAPSGDHHVHVEIQQVAPITMLPPNHLALGMIDEPGAFVILESQARFEWDGRVGYGYVERSHRM
ncbi:unannotated protein [freshwater metagenome]|uniref:Unannotated protein n=1 Tax=freshwater metagenome TaxID=449393 RepID=A0A6J7IAQ3_9ZZZZ|nr:hypothetical protein [Actinomycetota bacterium]